MNYFADPFHTELQEHYVEGSYGGLYLAMSQSWRDEWLPGSGTQDGFRIVLKDSTDERLYESRIYVAFDEASAFDDEYELRPVWTLMPYFYGSHHCPCHRKTDARKAGAETDEECEGDRFLIERVTPLDSDLILLSEVYSRDELERILRQEEG